MIAVLTVSFGYSQKNNGSVVSDNAETYQIVKVGQDYSSDILIELIEQGKFDAYRLNSKPRRLLFNDGSIVVLESNGASNMAKSTIEKHPENSDYPGSFELKLYNGKYIVNERVAYSGKPYAK